MIRIMTRNQLASAGGSSGEFQGTFDSLGTGIDQIGFVQGSGQERGHQFAKLDGWTLRIFTIDHHVRIFVQLVFYRLIDSWRLVSERASRNSSHKIQVFFVVGVENIRAYGV